MRVVFLDRDGVINEFPGNGNYVTKVKDFHFIPGSLTAIRKLTEKSFHIFVISNQAGVGKGVYSQHKLNLITNNMLEAVKKNGGKIKKVYYCIHRAEDKCECRKPDIGSIYKAMDTLNKTIKIANKAFFVGDTKADILAGHNAGCKTIFVLSGRETRKDLHKWELQPNYIAKNLLDAVEIINHNHAKKSRPKIRKLV